MFRNCSPLTKYYPLINTILAGLLTNVLGARFQAILFKAENNGSAISRPRNSHVYFSTHSTNVDFWDKSSHEETYLNKKGLGFF